jgi:hypothetical protein
MKTIDVLKAFGLTAVMVLGAGCDGGPDTGASEEGGSAEAEQVGEAEAPIIGGWMASTGYLSRSVYVKSYDILHEAHTCTGTIIDRGLGPALTEHRCGPGARGARATGLWLPPAPRRNTRPVIPCGCNANAS